MKLPPPISQNTENKEYTYTKRKRDSNLELYRIVVMLLIVAHHYVINSGLFQILQDKPFDITSNAMILFGAWGKTGIDCFLLITGYFMCKSKFSGMKLLKLYLQIVFYALIIYGIFCFTGHEEFSILTLIRKLFPIYSIKSGFSSCFLLFYLFIPFINKLIKNLSKKEHGYLVLLLLSVYTLIPFFPSIDINFNYVSWFSAIYIIASYLRFYSNDIKINHKQWRILALGSITLGAVSVLGLTYLFKLGYVSSFSPYYFISDSNAILAVIISVSSFMWFKDLKLKYSPLINLIGAATFGVLLIHANSNTMRQWLWKETVDCVGNYGDALFWSVGYAMISVLIIFSICSLIEIIRSKFFEPYILTFFEKTLIKKIQPKLEINSI